MQNVIIAIHLMVVVALVALVLYQKSEGGALGIGSSGFLTGRGQANALTRATGILGTIFFITSIALTVLPAWQRRTEGGADWTKALDQKIELKEAPAQPQTPGAPPPPADGKESIFEQLQRAQEQRQKGAPSAPPPAPAAPKVEAPKVETPAVKAPEPPAASAPPAKSPETKSPEAAPPEAATPAPAPKDAAPATSAPRSYAPSWLEPPASPGEGTSAAPAPKEAPPAAASKPAESPAASPPPQQWKSPTQ